MKFTAVVWQEEKEWVSLCAELNVASQGKTPEDALKSLKEAVELYIENAKELGMMNDILSKSRDVVFTSTIEV
jgi:predicted RNase H-like HicB family nuclease